MYYVCIMYVLCMYYVCIMYVLCIYYVCIMYIICIMYYVLCMYYVCIMGTCEVRPTDMLGSEISGIHLGECYVITIFYVVT